MFGRRPSKGNVSGFTERPPVTDGRHVGHQTGSPSYDARGYNEQIRR